MVANGGPKRPFGNRRLPRFLLKSGRPNGLMARFGESPGEVGRGAAEADTGATPATGVPAKPGTCPSEPGASSTKPCGNSMAGPGKSRDGPDGCCCNRAISARVGAVGTVHGAAECRGGSLADAGDSSGGPKGHRKSCSSRGLPWRLCKPAEPNGLFASLGATPGEAGGGAASGGAAAAAWRPAKPTACRVHPEWGPAKPCGGSLAGPVCGRG